MIKKIVAICDEFDIEYSRYQPWNIFYNLGKSLNSLDVEFVIITNKSTPKIIDGIKIIHISEQKIRKLSSDSIDKIISTKPDAIIWMGNPLSGSYIPKNNFGKIPVFLFISTFPMIYDDIRKLSTREILSENLTSLMSIFSRNLLVKKLNDKAISGIFTSTNSIKKRLESLSVLSEKISVMPLCFNPQSEHESASSEQSQFTMCYLGSMYSIRGVFLILDVLKKAKEQNFPLHLKFLLRSKNYQDLEILQKACTERKISELVSIKHEILEHSLVLEEITSSNVIILPPKFVWNDPPLAILEAMSMGKPVVTTNVCSIPEIVNDHAICSEPNADSLFLAIKSVFTDKTSAKNMANDAKNYVNTLPCWETCSKWILDIIDNFKK
jgi:glycosyltransferase involved in cell wall biosynthesis